MLRSINLSAVRRTSLATSTSYSSVSSCTTCLRTYATPSSSRRKPVAALAHSQAGYDPVMYSTPKPEPEPHRYNDAAMLPELRRHAPVTLPSPLPSDVLPSPTSMQANLYRSTSSIDLFSMVSICASRPDLVPRAFNIVNTLISDAKEGKGLAPATDLWVSVIYGMAQLCPPPKNAAEERTTGLWIHRVLSVVRQWEEFQNVRPGEPGLQREGIRIYQAWFRGHVRCGADLTPLLPYIQHPDITLDGIAAELSTDELDIALDRLDAVAENEALQWLSDAVSQARGVSQQKRGLEEREEIPEVVPVPETVKRSDPEVAAHSANYPEGHPQARFTIQNLRETLKVLDVPLSAYNRQMELERASYAAAEAELKDAADKIREAGLKDVQDAQKLKRNNLQSHMHRWHVALTQRLEENIADLRRKVADAGKMHEAKAPVWSSNRGIDESTLLLYLEVLPAKRLALITILELMRQVGSGGITDGMKMLRGVLGVGRAIESEHRAETIRAVAGGSSDLWKNMLDPTSLKPSRSNLNGLWRQLGEAGGDEEQLLKQFGPSVTKELKSIWTPPWTQMVQLNVGTHIVDALIQVARVERRAKDPMTGEIVSEDQPAFSHGYEYIRGKRLGVLRLNPAIAERMAMDSVRQVIHPKHLPMLVPPRPWNAWNDGAYLATPVQAMRFKDSVEQINYMREASKNGHLEPVFHGLDVLASTPWKINRRVFDVVLDAWNRGEAIAEIPCSAANSHYEMPEKPSKDNTDPIARRDFNRRMKEVILQQRKDHGERCKYNYTLEIARSYLNDTFYIPHNVDFRGRAYPIPPHLSPVGDDLCRGLLQFGVAKPLEKTGLKWLQIHLANVFGYDKASFEERAQFARDHEQDIFDSADNPINGQRWWLTAENPWQCLASCFELAAALRSPDPELFESSLPIHQDGTCNGMQHYAALGGDVRGAKAVNLEQGDRPADIYSGVAELVNKSIDIDRKNNLPIALMIEGDLGRKIVKQTVMTTVYGVTFVGARDQIARQLHAAKGISGDDLYAASAYVARKVLASIGDLFSGARAIQDWLTLSARLIARSIPPERVEAAARDTLPPAEKKTTARARKSTKSVNRLAKELMTSVVWTTPLGLPVVQPYRKESKKQVMTSLQTVYIHDPNVPAEVAPHKQATAFPPNYIHSLDATHMLLTAVKCHQSNITFASVHDSYWTHPSTVEGMSEAIRDTFIHLHSQNLVGELRQEFLDRYGDHCIPLKNAKLLASAAAKREADRHPRVDGSAVPSFEEEAELDGAEPTVEDEIKPGEEGIVPDEFGVNVDSLPTVEYGNTRFVRFRDVLPAAPARGDFDVERVRASKYFFS